MGFIARLFDSFQTPKGRPLVCGGCFKIFPANRAMVIPEWSAGASDFVTAYRCEKCRVKVFDGTLAKLRTLDDSSKVKFSDFLIRHGFPEMAESLRSAQTNDARDWTIKFLEQIRDGKIRLNP